MMVEGWGLEGRDENRDLLVLGGGGGEMYFY